MKMENMICKQCGGALDENLKCPYCGTRYEKKAKIIIDQNGMSFESDGIRQRVWSIEGELKVEPDKQRRSFETI